MTYEDVFRQLNRERIEYVVPRKYDKLPEGTVDANGDVDIIFKESQYDEGLAVCTDVGFEHPGPNSNLEQLAALSRQAVRKPVRAAQFIATRPHELVTQLRDPDRSNGMHRNIKLDRDDQRLDLRDNLAYKSPMNNRRIPVHPSVTERMLTMREGTGCFYIPEPCDELAHIVPHCVFDKKGRFPEYYTDRCESLFETVQNDDEQFQTFTEHLGKIFFEADDLVLELLADRRYSDIFTELRKYHEY